MAAVRALVEGTALPHVEIAARTGVPEDSVARWGRRFGWVRPGRGARPSVPDVASSAARREEIAGPRPRARRRYGEAEREVARAVIEGSRASMERIERTLGISTGTLTRWKRQGRWRRPEAPDARARPARYPTIRGRPYAADAVEAVRRLVVDTLLSHARIAKRVGIAQATVSEMIRRRKWVRPPARPSSPSIFASQRRAPLRTSGDRRGLPYTDETVAEARELFQQTELPAAIIAARVGVGVNTVYKWKRAGGWIRPRHLPDTYGWPRRRRRRWRPSR